MGEKKYKIDVHLVDARTGFNKIYKTEESADEFGEFYYFLWSEGNFACDCNRSLFLYGVVNQLPCNGGDNRILIKKIINSDTGEILCVGHDLNHQ